MNNRYDRSKPSHYGNNRQPIPRQWLNCQRRGEVIAGKFLAFKTPLDDRYSSQLNYRQLFTPEMFISDINASNLSLGVWIDLTNTSRYYDSNIVDKYRIKYVKLSCKGHDESPSLSQTREFIAICDKQFRTDGKKLVCVHCTHGFNRTGFLICAYLIEKLGYSVDAAINAFKKSRPPGIYKQHCIDDLFSRYNRNSYNRNSYDQNGYNRNINNRNSCDQNNYNRNINNRNSCDQNNYNRNINNRNSCDQNNYNRNINNRNSCDQNNYNRNINNRNSCDQNNYNRNINNRNSCDQNNYNRNSNNRNSYDQNGYKRPHFVSFSETFYAKSFRKNDRF